MYAAFFVLDIFYAANAIMTDADFWSQGGAGGVYQYIYAIFLYLGFLGGNIMLLNGMLNVSPQSRWKAERMEEHLVEFPLRLFV